MPNRVGRNEFNQALANTSIDVKKAEADPALKGALPANADLNQDGKIWGAQEVDKLFTQVDSFGRNPGAEHTTLG